MIRTLPLIIAIMVASSAPAFPDDALPEKPNIIFMLADDLGIVDVYAYAARFTGARPEQMFYETPHINRLIREGTAFSQAYACQLCSPTRASILTGKKAARIGFTTAVGGVVRTFYNQGLTPPAGYLAQDAGEWPDPNTKIPQALLNGTTLNALPAGQPGDGGRDEVTIAEALRGYRSAFIGKWHVGGHGSRGWQPHDQGFEEIAYFDEGGSPYFNWQPVWDRRGLVHPRDAPARIASGQIRRPSRARVSDRRTDRTCGPICPKPRRQS
jgi:arylsulfatase A-like enzyme